MERLRIDHLAGERTLLPVLHFQAHSTQYNQNLFLKLMHFLVLQRL